VVAAAEDHLSFKRNLYTSFTAASGSSATAIILHTHKDNQAAEHYEH
jgi:hypothetical protein